MRLVIPVGAALAALLVAGCGGNSYDAGTVEKVLAKSQVGKVAGLPLGAAACPKDVKLTEGVTFQCTLLINGVKAPYKVTLTNVKADKVRIDAEPAKALIPPSTVAAYVKSRITPSSLQSQAQVDCGDAKLLVVDPGAKIGCVVTIGKDKKQVSLTVRNTQGLIGLDP